MAKPWYGRTIQERFDLHWIPEPMSGCWLWLGTTNQKGYGRFNLSNRLYSAHRVAWSFKHGEIPEKLQVLHRCDTPACVNIDHLFLGTHHDNMLDRQIKGRTNPYPGQIGAAQFKRNNLYCKNGHPLFGINVYSQNDIHGFRRVCKKCNRIAKERHKKKMEAHHAG